MRTQKTDPAVEVQDTEELTDHVITRTAVHSVEEVTVNALKDIVMKPTMETETVL
jgi:hypothetical protein